MAAIEASTITKLFIWAKSAMTSKEPRIPKQKMQGSGFAMNW
jgi:hypothetical protein